MTTPELAAPVDEQDPVESAPTEENVPSDQEPEGQDESQEPGDSKDKPGKEPVGFQRRVSKLTERARLAQEEAEYWKSKALEATPKQEPAVSEKPKFSDYNDIEAYTDAVTEWKVSHALKQYEEQSKVQQRTQKVETTYQSRVEAFVKEAPDFVEAVAEFIEEQYPISNAAVEFIQDSEIGPKLTYHLAKNPEEAERISRLSAVRQIAELGKLEDKLSAKTPSKTSSAPPPVKSTAGKAVIKSELKDELSYSDWKKLREAQLKRK